MFDASAAYSLGGLSATTVGLRANVDNSTITITNSNQLSVYKIDQRHISSDSFGQGISGGDGAQIYLNTNEGFFSYDEDNKLIPLTIPDKSVTFDKLDLNIIGEGLKPALNQIVANVKGPGEGLVDDGYGYLNIANTTPPGNSFFRSLEYNSKGQILSADYTIATTLSCNTTSPVLSVFNGSPSQAELTNQTLLTVLSTGGSNNLQSAVQLVLSSAGFIAFESTTTRDLLPVGRFAIPIFTY
jgi:hypothetical protein